MTWRMRDALGVLRRLRLYVLLVCVLLLGAAALSPRRMPYNMDEFVHYQPLSCHAYPLTRQYNIYRETCDQYALRPPGMNVRLPLRSYLYIGSFPVIPFYPFWRILGAPVAVRIQGAFFFLIAATLVARLAGSRFMVALLAALIFPLLSINFLVDLGPVGVSLVLLLTALLLIRAAARAVSEKRGVLLAALAGAALFLGLQTKLVFAWSLPAVGLFCWREARRAEGSALLFLRRRPARIAAFVAMMLAPALVFLLSRDVAGRPFYAAAAIGEACSRPKCALRVARTLGRYLWNAAVIIPGRLHGPPTLIDRLPVFLSLSALAWVLWRTASARRAVLFWLACFALAFGVTCMFQAAWAAHHLALSLVFLVLALAVAFSSMERGGRLLLAAIAALTITTHVSLWARIEPAWFESTVDAAKDQMLDFSAACGWDRSMVLVHNSWGTFFIDRLFGDRSKTTIYVQHLADAPPRLAYLRSVAERLGRGIVIFTSDPQSLDAPSITRVLGPPRATYRFGDWTARQYLR